VSELDYLSDADAVEVLSIVSFVHTRSASPVLLGHYRTLAGPLLATLPAYAARLTFRQLVSLFGACTRIAAGARKAASGGVPALADAGALLQGAAAPPDGATWRDAQWAAHGEFAAHAIKTFLLPELYVRLEATWRHRPSRRGAPGAPPYGDDGQSPQHEQQSQAKTPYRKKETRINAGEYAALGTVISGAPAALRDDTAPLATAWRCVPRRTAVTQAQAMALLQMLDSMGRDPRLIPSSRMLTCLLRDLQSQLELEVRRGTPPPLRDLLRMLGDFDVIRRSRPPLFAGALHKASFDNRPFVAAIAAAILASAKVRAPVESS
jgi:hypothetical protein